MRLYHDGRRTLRVVEGERRESRNAGTCERSRANVRTHERTNVRTMIRTWERVRELRVRQQRARTCEVRRIIIVTCYVRLATSASVDYGAFPCRHIVARFPHDVFFLFLFSFRFSLLETKVAGNEGRGKGCLENGRLPRHVTHVRLRED